MQRELESLFPDDFPDLGQPRQIHSPRRGTPRERVSVGILLMVLAPAALAVAIFLKPDNPDDVPVVRGLFGTLFAGIAIGGAVMLVLGLKRRGRWVGSRVHWMVYDDGLV